MHMWLICGVNGTPSCLPSRNPDLKHLASHEATPEIWQETYVSALLRAILYSDDPAHWVEAYRKLDPITSREGELRFLQACEALFHKGNTCVLFLHRWVHLCIYRLAGRIRPGDPGRHCCLEPSCCRNYEVLWR
jgi:hypothetical protein